MLPNQRPRHFLYALLLSLFATLWITACQADLRNPPRLATAEAHSQTTPTPTAEPMQIPAPTPTASSNSRPDVIDSSTGQRPSLTVWINETSAEHAALLDSLASDYAVSSGVNIALQMIAPDRLPDLVNTAVLSDTLPDMILHPVEFSAGWEARGILNSDAAAQALAKLDPDTFDAAALALLTNNGRLAGLPSDGHHQLWLYRSDWFEEANLPPPTTFNRMLAGAQRLYDKDNLISGIVVPTESNLINTQRVFEQIAIANGCNLINEAGEVQLISTACQQALDFYFSIINQFSPSGVQTDTSARSAFLQERTAIIMTSPALLHDLAEADLIDKTGILTDIEGTAEAENLGRVTVLGITSEADPQTAVDFATYWFETAYPQWLAIESERKVPMRTGSAENPTQFRDAWATTPFVGSQSLRDLYGEEVANQLSSGIASTNRWGITQDQGEIATSIYEELTFSIVLQEMLSGYFDSNETLFEAYRRVVELIPGYPFELVPTPTPVES